MCLTGVSWDKLESPGSPSLQKDYDLAHQRLAASHSGSRSRVYRSKVGALIYTSPCVRVDACYVISRLSRAQTFPTEALEAHADRVIVYLAQTAARGCDV